LECEAAKKRIEVLEGQKRAQRAAERRELEVQKKEDEEKERERRSRQSRLQNVSESSLSFFDMLRCLKVGLEGLMNGNGFSMTYSAESIKLKMERFLDKVATSALKKWAAQTVNLRMAGMDVNEQSLKDWFHGFSGQYPKTEVASMKPLEIKKWLKIEIGRVMYEEKKWTKVRSKDSQI
jgi:hypothetical protein